MSGVDELVAFVQARLNEREALLLHTRASDIRCPIPISTLLAEVEAKRRILDAGAPRREREETGEYLHFGNWSSCSDDCAGTVWWEILKLLAQPYAGQDGWREEWAL